MSFSREHMTVENMPIITDYLHSRPFHCFIVRHYHLYENCFRKEQGMWMPSEKLHPEVTGWKSADLWSEWPTYLEKDIEQPAALPVPMPLDIRFFHDLIACLYKRYGDMEDWAKD